MAGAGDRLPESGAGAAAALDVAARSQAYPAREIIALYHERWEIELGYDELKTEMLERKEALRSKSPEAVAQEIWGLLLVYNLVRGSEPGCDPATAAESALRT